MFSNLDKYILQFGKYTFCKDLKVVAGQRVGGRRDSITQGRPGCTASHTSWLMSATDRTESVYLYNEHSASKSAHI